MIKEFAYLRGGLVLVTGPTGSGKTTTQAALIDFINRKLLQARCDDRGTDRIRAQQQAQHHHATGSAGQIRSRFAAGLKAALREDTDIVLVGEMRDLETISLALTAAETGLLVFGTLHTNNARKTVDRMVDAFPADRQATGARHAGELTSRRSSATAFEKVGPARPHRRKRNSDRERSRCRHHSRRCNAKTPGRDRFR